MSHFWDMTAAAEERTEGFHGAQVGVATVATAALYEYLAALSPDRFDPDRIIARRPTLESEIAVIERIHGEFADEVTAEYRRKRPSDEDLRDRVLFLKAHWRDLFAGLADVLRPPRRIRDILHAAGAPLTIGELSLTPGHLQHGFRTARYIRDRYTVLDLAFDVGILDDAADDILKQSGCLG